MLAGPVTRWAERRHLAVTPDDPGASLHALRAVIQFTITDALGLLPEESMWLGYHLDIALSPLVGQAPEMVTIAMRQEMLTRAYSRKLQELESVQPAAPQSRQADTAYATAADWAGVVMESITHCYQLRPLTESTMHGQIVGLFRELGVDQRPNPRGTRYLPSDLRDRLNTMNRGRRRTDR
jgi:hypothetical protein